MWRGIYNNGFVIFDRLIADIRNSKQLNTQNLKYSENIQKYRI